jgi:hypothetical protein
MTKRSVPLVFLTVLALAPIVPPEVGAVPNPRTPTVNRKGPLRVLLFATAPSREYQFVRSLLYREVREKRLVLGIYLQSGEGKDVDQDVDKEWLLSRFPDLRKAGKPKDRPYCLLDYDVVVAFDPDWTSVPEATQKLLRNWVEDERGGLVLIAGPVHTPKLGKLVGKAKYKAIIDLYPVDFKDKKPPKKLPNKGQPYGLRFQNVTKAQSFLKLNEKGRALVAGWDEFFYDSPTPKETDKPVRGFYTAYPVRKQRAVSTVLAQLGAGKERLPFLITMQPGLGKVVYLGSGETWRLRLYREAFHKRFWLQLLQYSGARSK